MRRRARISAQSHHHSRRAASAQSTALDVVSLNSARNSQASKPRRALGRTTRPSHCAIGTRALAHVLPATRHTPALLHELTVMYAPCTPARRRPFVTGHIAIRAATAAPSSGHAASAAPTSASSAARNHPMAFRARCCTCGRSSRRRRARSVAAAPSATSIWRHASCGAARPTSCARRQRAWAAFSARRVLGATRRRTSAVGTEAPPPPPPPPLASAAVDVAPARCSSGSSRRASSSPYAASSPPLSPPAAAAGCECAVPSATLRTK